MPSKQRWGQFICLLALTLGLAAPAAAQKPEGPPPPPPASAAKVLSVSITSLNQVLPEKAYTLDSYKVTVRNDTLAQAVYFYVWAENAFGAFQPVVVSSSAGRFSDQIGWWVNLAYGQTATVNFTARNAGAQRYCSSGEKQPVCASAPA